MREHDRPERGEAADGLTSSRRTLIRSIVGAGVLPAGIAGRSVADSGDFLNVLSVDPSSYPNVRLNVSVDTPAGRNGELTREDFTVVEDGVEKAIESFAFSSTAADIVFVFDDTGSMSNEISDMKRKVKDLTDSIASADIDARYSLVSFKDDVETDLALTDDPTELKSKVNDLSARGGGDGPEDNFDAIERALGFEFRGEAQRVIIDITDNVSHYEGDGSGFSEYTIDEVAADLQEAGATYIAVAPDWDDPNASKRALAERSGGLWIDINGADFSKILERIVRTIVTTYVLEYVTDALPGATPPISVTVSDPDEGTATDEGELTVPSDAERPFAEFESAREEKEALADRIDDAAVELEEQPRVTDTLDGLASGLEAGAFSQDAAVEAVERMKFAENVSEETLVALGPPETTGGEDSDTFVGSTVGTEFNVVGRTTKLITNMVIEVLISKLSITKVIKKVPGVSRLVSRAKSKTASLIKNVVERLAGKFDDQVRRIIGDSRTIADNIFGLIQDEADAAANDVLKKQAKQSSGLRERTSEAIRGQIESGALFDAEELTDMDEKLTEADETFGGDSSSSPSLSGTREGARRSMTDGIDRVNGKVRSANSDIDTFLDIADFAGIVAAVSGLISALSGGILATVFGPLATLAGALSTLATAAAPLRGFAVFLNARDVHNQAVEGVIQGEVM